MLQVARLAPKQLGDSRDLVAAFLQAQRNPDGGFRDRAGNSDLYYTVFGLEGLIALQADPQSEATSAFVRGFGDGERLDFIHLTCLPRVWATMTRDGSAPRQAILDRIENHRSADGGYHPSPGSPMGSLYAAFLALGAYQDLGAELPQPERLHNFVATCQAREGGYAIQPGISLGLTTTTAAAVAVLRQLDAAVPPETAAWLSARFRNDGFCASASTPLPDLLSTATALHALTSMQVDLKNIQEPCLDFVDTLWTNRGGFCGSWADPTLDCEYTYYGLLALGHLSL